MDTPLAGLELRGDEAGLLLGAAQALAAATTVPQITAPVRTSARALVGADGVAFVLREGDEVHYVDEDAIGPLWRGRRFPAAACISGWAMQHRRTVVIEDVYADPRIPHDLYRPTFVKSLAMVPVRPEAPVAAIGAYWAARHLASPREVALLEALAGFAALALSRHAAVADLEDAARAREEFLAIAAHELRTPISALRLQVEQLARTGGGPPESTARLRRTTDRLARLVDTLLDATRVAERGVTLDPEPLDLAAVVREAAERLAAPGQELRVSAPSEVAGRWDRATIEQALDNLLANAAKFGGGRPIALDLTTGGGWARLQVEDHGIGIQPADVSRIFGRFERAVTSRHFGGFGVGLWLARRNVEAHGGRVTVESEPGAWTRFTILLPLEPAAPQLAASAG
jgi:two-component system CheB/CheR fusion protein